jgi:hypothetical protein
MQNRFYPTDVTRHSQLPSAGRVRAALLIYLLAFSIALVLFVHGLHVTALITLMVTWAALALWLRRGR